MVFIYILAWELGAEAKVGDTGEGSSKDQFIGRNELFGSCSLGDG